MGKQQPVLTKSFFSSRREKLLEQIPINSVVFVVSADQLPRNGDQSFPYRQSSDLFYLTGINQEQTILVLNPNHPKESLREVLFIRKSSPELEKWQGHKLTKDEAREISGVKTVFWYDQFEDFLPEFMYYVDNVFVGTNDNLGYKRFYNDAELRFIERLRFLYPLHNFQRLGRMLTNMRLIKTKEELEIIKYAIWLTGKAFERVLHFIKPGVMEYQIEAEIIHEFLRHNVRNVAYQSIIASGKNACVLHYINNNSVCKEGDLVLMDFGAEYLNYAADLTRTVPVSGKFTDFQKDVYQAVLDVQRTMIAKYVKPGTTIEVLNNKTRKLMGEKLVELGLLEKSVLSEPQEVFEQKVKKYFPHGLSHFMGLDVHDVGTKNTVLQPGMIITVEPGIYIDDMELGIRLENDVLITEDGNVDLMADIPIEADEIESIMNGAF